MRSHLRFVACLATLFSSSLALEFTSPTSDSQIDPSKSVVISWSLSLTDPSVIDLKLTNSDSSTDLTIATGVVSYTGSYTVPAGSIQGSGSGYKILAVGNGNTLDQITGLTFGSKNDQSSSGGTGQVTLVTTATVIPTPAATGSTVPTATIDSVGVVTMPGTVTGSESTTRTAGSSFTTSTTNKASSESNGAVATSAGTTNTANGQKRRGGELILSAAGLLAGVIALLA
ncbi:uncharacterized protein Z519_03332 [Cladophialophora bantiana CBS 173.52]|uniref:Yeast cell wall synthesis Kre9/Knh1-like N-terminal domain-containing protein n=1 Tax=Cladophialophora bantiana (strain ATCC 10958 / CBS 173.52 / CDC B-1940 / NIH 8579) TaxID=1442370 RepID=A0A0D2IHR4_CLAB1|nr:uncharacterized protein Z519_03332 [Cladophialophora bantiana CBS 173.52]KIW96264.1 hypothetical protein Z519_03332 [Cladophialophora bantiana CBS 173.52]